MGRKVKDMPLNQTFIEVPPSPGAVAGLSEQDRRRAYAELMGNDALARQVLAWKEANTCNCGRDSDAARYHKAGCPKAPKRRARV